MLNLIEEIESLQRQEIRRIYHHLTKALTSLLIINYYAHFVDSFEYYEYQYSKVYEHSVFLKGIVEQSPSLKEIILTSEFLQKAWELARLQSALYTGNANKITEVPELAIWTIDEVMNMEKVCIPDYICHTKR